MGSKKRKEKKVGYRFRPEEGFLVAVLDRLVHMKAKGLKFDLDDHTEYPGELFEMVMYGPGKEPWKIFSGDHEILELHQTSDPERKIREKYVVAKLNRVGDKNFSRIAGAGCWLDKSKKTPVYVGGREVGHWRTLTYEYSGAVDGKSYYFMNELHLAKRSDYVICRVMKNLSKGCRVKIGTKRLRQEDDDKDCRPAAKRSRRREEETPEESSSCSDIVHLLDETLEEEEEEEDQECTSQPMDFSELFQESNPVCDPELLLFDPDLLSKLLDECSDTCQEQAAYVPDMSGLAQNEEEQGFFDFPQLQQDWVPSSSTFDDQWSFEELMNSVPPSCC